jgi:histidinol-phosphate/aromatic aminotransferase/cobyric acid decarboxylase-like protein
LLERIHGGALANGVDPAKVVDFSVNLNPYGPCEPVLRAARAAELAHYPDMHAREARRAWAEALACDPSELAVGHGAADLLWAIARAFAGKRVKLFEPTFSEFRIAALAAGAELCDVEPDCVYLCSPNNPTGEYTTTEQIRALASASPRTAWVIDQSFLGLSPHASDALARLPANVIRVRSLTKEFACPGLRIGWCRAQPAWIERIEAQRPSWATSSPALAALVASAREGDFVRASFERMRLDRDATRTLLQARGYDVMPSETTYQLVEVGDARAFTARLVAHGVLVRDCSSFGLPRHVRVAALPVAQRAVLAAALDAIAPA